MGFSGCHVPGNRAKPHRIYNPTFPPLEYEGIIITSLATVEKAQYQTMSTTTTTVYSHNQTLPEPQNALWVSLHSSPSTCSGSRVFADCDLIYSTGAKTGDWLAELRDNGFAVIKNAIPQDRAIAYQQKAREWLK